MSKALEGWMKQMFDLGSLRKAGVFPKEIKSNDFEGMAAVLCKMLGLESIYDYGKHEIRCHLSYAGERPKHVDKNGELKEEPFITVFNENPMHL